MKAKLVLATSLFFVLGFQLICQIQIATAASYSDYSAWTNLLPTEQCYPYTLMNTGSTGSVSSATDSILISTSSDADYFFYQHNQQDIDISYPFVVETEMKVVSSTNSSSSLPRDIGSICVDLATYASSADEVCLWMGASRMFLTNGTMSIGQSTTVDFNSFHKIRLVVQENGASEVYLDDGGTPVLTGSKYNVAYPYEKRILWGDTTGYAAGVTEWKYISHNACKKR